MLVSDTPPTLDQVLAGQDKAAVELRLEQDINQLRLDALKSGALSYGTQAGFQRRTFEIAEITKAKSAQLDQVYNFQGLLLERNVVPPVLQESRDTLQASGDTALRLADRSYQVIKQARFTVKPPTWQEYLLRSVTIKSEGLSDSVLAPRNDAEEKFWKAQVQEGWKLGVQQADQVFAADLARLDRDYKGMVLYRHLLTRKMVSLPYVAESKLGVTGDANNMSINDRVLRITALPELDTRSERWSAPILPSAGVAGGSAKVVGGTP
ncbi:type IV secretory system conjugative DNA transfer family protein [Xanthomonas euvesicatoria]|uniref:type IV secretory system conjugative DNA transfer family protein n=1 Tax=Xanthomonas euvesicatoria TaxID=456327 RepID=UPI00080E1B3D|nr:type IV secretory system conjugative DNA transfer family protein [Xanthomonas euvesicatoria]